MLKDLESWNRERWQRYKTQQAWMDARRTGFACPRCREELWRTDPNLVYGDMQSSPAIRDIYCPKCQYVGIECL